MLMSHRLVLAALALLMALALVFVPAPVLSHSWYPMSCCSDKDCFEVGPADVTATAEGWRIESSGEVIPFDDPRIRMTPPEGGQVFHVCHIAGDPTARALCLFVPEFGA